MNTQGKISGFQFFSMLTVSRLLSMLTFVPAFDFKAGISDCIAASIAGSVFILIASIPAFAFLNKSKGESLIGFIGKSRRAKRIISALYAIFLLFNVNFTLLRLKLFVSSVFFDSLNTQLFTVLTVAAVCYGVSFGLEAVARVSVINLSLVFVSLGVIFFSLGKNIDVNNLSALFYYGASPVFRIALSILARTGELSLIYLLLPRVTGNVKKGFVIWLAVISLALTLTITLLAMSLSDSTLIMMFPFHAMSELSEFSIIERMDAVLAGIWIMSAFVKAILFTLAAGEVIEEGFERRIRPRWLVLSAIPFTALLILEEKSVTTAALVSSVQLRELLFLIFVLTVPCIIMYIQKKRRRQKI